jgi:hypothetical protein
MIYTCTALQDGMAIAGVIEDASRDPESGNIRFTVIDIDGARFYVDPAVATDLAVDATETLPAAFVGLAQVNPALSLGDSPLAPEDGPRLGDPDPGGEPVVKMFDDPDAEVDVQTMVPSNEIVLAISEDGKVTGRTVVNNDSSSTVIHNHAAPVAAPLEPELPRAFITKREGAKFVNKTYHLSPDCRHSKHGEPGQEVMLLDEATIEFMGLDLCDFCARRANRISAPEAAADAVKASWARQAASGGGVSASALATDVIAFLDALGFKISPELVDRPQLIDPEPLTVTEPTD